MLLGLFDSRFEAILWLYLGEPLVTAFVSYVLASNDTTDGATGPEGPPLFFASCFYTSVSGRYSSTTTFVTNLCLLEAFEAELGMKLGILFS